MGVVRREGDWRLEKRRAGVYEITLEEQPQEVILTPEYSPDLVDTYTAGTLPVHHVDSYAEAEGLFEERAHSNRSGRVISSTGNAPLNTGMAETSTAGGQLGQDLDAYPNDFEGLGDVEELSLGVLALLMIAVGALLVWTSEFQFGSTMFGIGGMFFAVGLAIVGWGIVVTDDLTEAVEYLSTVHEDDSTDSKSDQDVQRTPPAPQSLKDELYFDRAEQTCEWCGDHLDHPEVHHIEPRNEGGPNEPKNLIVLCSNCHTKADRDAIPRSKLKAKVRRITES